MALGICAFALVTASVHAQADHVFYVGTDDSIHEDYYASGAWHTSNTTVSASAPAPNSTSPLAGVVVGRSGSTSAHVFFIEGNGDIGEAYFNGQWHYTNDTIAAGAVPANLGGGLIAIQTSTFVFHVFFLANDGQLGEIWFDGANFHYDEPSAITNVGGPQGFIGASAFRGGEYIFYVDNFGQLRDLSFTSSWSSEVLTTGLRFDAPLTAFPCCLSGGAPTKLSVIYNEGDPANPPNVLGEASSQNGSSWSLSQLPIVDAVFFPMSPTIYGSTWNDIDLFYINVNAALREERLNFGTFSTVVAGPQTNSPIGGGMASLLGTLGVEVYYPDFHVPSHLEVAYGNESSRAVKDLTASLAGTPGAEGTGIAALRY